QHSAKSKCPKCTGSKLPPKMPSRMVRCGNRRWHVVAEFVRIPKLLPGLWRRNSHEFRYARPPSLPPLDRANCEMSNADEMAPFFVLALLAAWRFHQREPPRRQG